MALTYNLPKQQLRKRIRHSWNIICRNWLSLSRIIEIIIYIWQLLCHEDSGGFTYNRLDRLKPRALKLSGSPAKVYNIFITVIGLSYLCCHNVMYFLNNPSVILLTQLHSISEYCRILNTLYQLRLYGNWLNTLPSSSSREGGELGPQKWNSIGPLFI